MVPDPHLYNDLLKKGMSELIDRVLYALSIRKREFRKGEVEHEKIRRKATERSTWGFCALGFESFGLLYIRKCFIVKV